MAIAKSYKDGIKQTITVAIGAEVYEIDLEEMAGRLRIDPSHLDEELEEQSAFYLWIAVLAASANSDAEDEKQGFDIFYNELLSDVRRDMEEAGTKPTVSGVESDAKASEEYGTRLEVLLTARRTADVLNVIKEASRMRQYLLIERSRRASRDEAAALDE